MNGGEKSMRRMTSDLWRHEKEERRGEEDEDEDEKEKEKWELS